MIKDTAVIIVNWNGIKYLNNCLESVFSQTYKNFDLYFIDNGSKDKSIDLVKNNFPQIKIIKLTYNSGFSRGNNIGIKKAFQDKEVKYIVFLNNDTIVNQNWLAELVKAAEKDKRIGMVGSKVLFPNSKIHTVGLSLEKNLHGNRNGGISIGFNSDGNIFNRELAIFAPPGVSALYKKRVIKKIGLFDEDFFCYGEDLDLGFRARLNGWKCIYNPESKLIHLHSQTGGTSSSFKAFYTRRNSYFVAIKNLAIGDLLLFPFRDIVWNIKQLSKKNRVESVSKIKDKIGLRGIMLIMIKVYASVLINIPRMTGKRFRERSKKKVSKKEYKEWFNKFSRDTIEKNQ